MDNFKKFLIPFLSLFLILSLTGLGCGLGKDEVAKEEVTLTMWHLFDSEEVFKPIIADYQKEHPNIKIKFIKKDYSEYEDDSLNALAEGAGPDIWLIRNDWVVRHHKKLVPMPEGMLSAEDEQKRSDVDVFKDNFVPVVADDVVVDNKIYGLPLYVDTLALYYNKDLFREKQDKLYEEEKIETAELLEEAPQTWNDVVRVNKLLTKREGENIKQAGIALGLSGNVDQAIDIVYALMLQNHTKMVADDKKSSAFNLSILNEAGEPVYPGTHALEFYASFSDPGKEAYSWNTSMPNDVEAFAQGKLAMMINYSFRIQTLSQIAPNLNYEIAPLPQIKGETTAVDYASYWVETVTQKCSHPKVAWDFIKYLATTQLDTYLSSAKRPSPLRSSDVPAVNKRLENKSNTFRFQAMTAKSWYKGKYPLKIDQIFLDLIDAVTIYGQPFQNAIDTAATKATHLLKKE